MLDRMLPHEPDEEDNEEADVTLWPEDARQLAKLRIHNEQA